MVGTMRQMRSTQVSVTAQEASLHFTHMRVRDFVTRLYHWLAAHFTDEWLVALVAAMLSIGAYWWYARNGLQFGYADALSRMMIARRVLVSRTPGLAQLGTTWLPLHMMLMLPLIWIDPLFHDGLAGSFPSMVAYVVAAVYIFRTGHLVFASRWAGWVAAAALMFNANLLYMQTTAMSEVVLLCTTVLIAYYALRWAHSYQALDLVKAGVAAAAGTLVRYDAWATAAAVAGIVAYIAWRRQGYKGAEAWSILYGLVGFAGCVAWLIYNAVIFHDPLLGIFGGNSKHSSLVVRLLGAPTSQQGGSTPLPFAYHNPWRAFEMYGFPVLDTVGMLVVLMGSLGLLVFVSRFRLTTTALPAYVFLVPFAFYWLVFYTGFDEIHIPELGMGYWNNRFALQMLPAAALFSAALTSLTIRRRHFHLIRQPLLVACVGVIFLLGILGSTAEIPYLLREPLPTGSVFSARQSTIPAEAQWLISHYRGGNVLISYVPHAPIMFYMFGAIPDHAFITDANGPIFSAALEHPETSVTWIVLVPDDQENFIWAGLSTNHTWHRYFVLRKTIGYTQFYERVGDSRVGDPRPEVGVQASRSGFPLTLPSSYRPALAGTPHISHFGLTRKSSYRAVNPALTTEGRASAVPPRTGKKGDAAAEAVSVCPSS